jgi:hypothetical protein
VFHFPFAIFHLKFVIAGLVQAQYTMTNENDEWQMENELAFCPIT